MKCHLGNATIYLTDGWVNVDLFESGSALAKHRLVGVLKWGTTESNYYAKLQQINRDTIDRGTPDHDDMVCDAYGSWGLLPFGDGTVDEILSRQCFEHLSRTEAKEAMQEAWRVLKPGGIMRLDVPDHEEALRQFADTKDEFMLRHILGSRKNDYAWHMGSWTRNKLIAFCGRHGFTYQDEEPNIHFYPAFCLRFQRGDMPRENMLPSIRPWKAAWEYAGNPRGTELVVEPEDLVLEIGPGRAHWPRANVFVDIDQEHLSLCPTSAETRIADVQHLPEEWTGRFDYVLTSHILEHVEDPLAACRELERVAKRGVIVCPSPMKESLFNFHESDHKWWVMKVGWMLLFIPLDKEWRDRLHDADVEGWMHRLWRYGLKGRGDAEKLRQWYHRAEPELDTIYEWTGNINAVVIR